MARRDPGFAHLIGAFDATLAFHNVDTAVVQSWLPPGLTLDPAPTAPEGQHPYYLGYIVASPCHWSILPLMAMKVRAMALVVPNVRIITLKRGYLGPYGYVLRWWSAGERFIDLGGHLWGLPPAPERVRPSVGKIEGLVEVPGQVSMATRDHGEIPEWPRVRELCRLLQLPLLTQRPNGRLSVVGMYWNVSDADMRACETRLEVLPGALPPGALVPDGKLGCAVDGTRNMLTGGTFRMGSICTMTRAGPPEKDWSPWRSGPRLRLRVDLSPNEIGPWAEKQGL